MNTMHPFASVHHGIKQYNIITQKKTQKPEDYQWCFQTCSDSQGSCQKGGCPWNDGADCVGCDPNVRICNPYPDDPNSICAT